MIQGHLLAEPMGPTELESWLADGGDSRLTEMLSAHRDALERSIDDLSADAGGEGATIPGLSVSAPDPFERREELD